MPVTEMIPPCFILVRPQMGENIGAAARAMLNFGLERMRIVAPRDGWPNSAAVAMASGAGRVLDQAGLFPDVQAAISDCDFIFATTAQDSWHEESWTSEGSVTELRGFYADFHPDARALLSACDSVLKTALYERDPLPNWSQGHITLLGDASHPMMPFMAQGAGMAIEDGVVLARCLAPVQRAQDVPAALARYEDLRLERTSRIQIGSRGNNWLRDGGNADWVYGYDAWQVPVAA